MGGIQRAHLVIAAANDENKDFALAVDRELQQISELAETREVKTVYNLPQDTEGQIGDRWLLIDSEGELGGNRNDRYLLVRFNDGWYRYAAMTKIER